VVVANGSGAAVVGLIIGIILAAEAAGWGGDDGDGLALDSDSAAGDDTTTSSPAVPTSVDGGTTARPHPDPDDAAVITVTDRSGRTVVLAVPPADGSHAGGAVVRILADHNITAANCPDVIDPRRHPLCDPTTRPVAIGVDGRGDVGSTATLDGAVDALSDDGFVVVRSSP
jgi:hypothetical protein